jgi:hypothetical protein
MNHQNRGHIRVVCGSGGGVGGGGISRCWFTMRVPPTRKNGRPRSLGKLRRGATVSVPPPPPSLSSHYSYRYDFGGTVMPAMRTWMREERGVNFDSSSLGQTAFFEDIVQPTVVPAFVAAVEGQHGGFSLTPEDRLYRSHGTWLFCVDHVMQMRTCIRPGTMSGSMCVWCSAAGPPPGFHL